MKIGDVLVLDTNAMPWEPKTNPVTGKSNRRKTLMVDPDTGMNILITDNPAGNKTPTHIHNCSHGMFVLHGTQRTPVGDFGPGNFIWFPQGVVAEHGATDIDPVTVLFISNKTFDINFLDVTPAESEKEKIQVFDTNAMPWIEGYNEAAGKNLYRKPIIPEDPDTGVKIQITNYPGGFINPKHDHHCAHGMYVLNGRLKTDVGEFGPGHFLWFPEGNVMYHGSADPYGPGVQVLFITNKKFDINYLK